jgi:hypothetical protein
MKFLTYVLRTEEHKQKHGSTSSHLTTPDAFIPIYRKKKNDELGNDISFTVIWGFPAEVWEIVKKGNVGATEKRSRPNWRSQ